MKAKIISVLTLGILGAAIYSSSVYGLEYQTNAGINFTISPSISLSISGDLIIDELAPGNYSDSNVIDITVLSNNSTGYILKSSVGSSDSPYSSYNRNLVNTASSNAFFTSLDYNSSLSTLSNFDPNTWGYSYSDQMVVSPTWSNYSGLPLYSDTEHITTLRSSNQTTASTGDRLKFKIGARADDTLAAGEYQNLINFIAVGNPKPVSFYDAFEEAAAQPGSTITMLNGYYKMQDMSADICSAVELYDDQSHIQLIDTRDNEVYWVGKLKDERCWLLDNLRLGSNDHTIELTPQDTNIEAAWTLPKGVTSNFNSWTNAKINATYKYNTDVVSYGTASGKIGVYYNYCAASGGTYCYDGSSGMGNAGHDICPFNWRMPTGGTSSEYQTLNAEYDTPNNFRIALSTPLSGNFHDASTHDWNVVGYFWSSTYGNNSQRMLILRITQSDIDTAYNIYRHFGRSLRCIANNQ
ncbi:hypothetical protein IKG05_00150 [Candidatus Saccharibacteria bacterium]|nr:hypothetical protein [Candidatus Saccharibacteria bacterium]